MRLQYEFFRVVILILTLSLISLSTPAQAIDTVPKDIADASNPVKMGILNIPEGSEVYVNGNLAQDGMTVLTGTNLETRSNGATVEFNDLGIVRICPQTRINLKFSSERVEIKLTSGNARLDTDQNGSGEIQTPANGNLKTDATGSASTPSYDSANCGFNIASTEPFSIVAIPRFFTIFGIAGGALATTLISNRLNRVNGSATSISSVVP